jgi:hypothetical protein
MGKADKKNGICSGFWSGIEEWAWEEFLPIVLHAYP